MLRTRDGCEKISLKLFTSVWSESFGKKLAIREPTGHAMCQICCRHKHILKSLSGDRLGRQCQMQMYSAHLKRQYEDRCLYWQARAASRMNAITADSTQQVCCIVDGMDHSKFRYPRSLAMLSKEYDFLQRPHLNMHAILAHGHMCLLSLADITVPKDASFCVELLSHCLHCISDRLDLRVTRLLVQCDNTCRELKNNCTLRAMSQWVANSRLWNCELRCLQKGHSHEDVDAFFANVAVTVEKYNELHRPCNFQEILQQYLDGGARRHEPLKRVVQVDEVRDWSTFLNVAFDGAHLKGIGGPGAPHTFLLERFCDTGLSRDVIDNKFWSKVRKEPEHPCDVVLRTGFSLFVGSDVLKLLIVLLILQIYIYRAKHICRQSSKVNNACVYPP
ncbi:unnamed protein product [Cladocopium goreaui]|uniref:DUF7869 domain-containing protein n=1 Tax=Cladocopium goreaui TaxID=2562237 RepID=A0A9P1GCS0_9DINO|nr:unnamed protein product [Cladocopium goreaui]